MGDFAAKDLWEASYLNVAPGMPCEGCWGRIDPEDRCYGAGEHIWHSRCWPEKNGARRQIEADSGRWRHPTFTPR